MGFTAVAVEAGWPDAYRINRYVRETDDDPVLAVALAVWHGEHLPSPPVYAPPIEIERRSPWDIWPRTVP